MRTHTFQLDDTVSGRIENVWRERGSMGAAMFGQPVKRNGRYALRFVVLASDEAERVQAVLDEIKEQRRRHAERREEAGAADRRG